MGLTSKPKGWLKRLVDRARTEIERRSRPPAALEENGFPVPSAAPVPVAAHQPSPEATDPHSRMSADEPELLLEATFVSAGQLAVRFAGAERHFAGGRQLLGPAATPQLRVVALHIAGLEIARERFDVPVALPRGEVSIATPPAAACVVALGLASAAEFVPVAHCALRP